MDQFKDDTLGPAGSSGQAALCETLKQYSENDENTLFFIIDIKNSLRYN